MIETFICGRCNEQYNINDGVQNGYSVEFQNILICGLCNYELNEEIFDNYDSMYYSCPNGCCLCCGCSCGYYG